MSTLVSTVRLSLLVASITSLVAPVACSGQESITKPRRPNEVYVICSLVDDPHKSVYYSGVFSGTNNLIHTYEKAFSTHLEMMKSDVIGTAKCSSYEQERGAKASLASLQEDWHWIYKNSVPTNWSYVPLTPYSSQ